MANKAKHSSAGWRFSSLRISERRLLLKLGDNGILWLVLALVCVYRLDKGLTFPSIFWTYPGWFILLSALWLILANAFMAYDLQKSSNWLTIGWTMLQVVPLTALLYGLIPYITPYLLHSRLTWTLFAVLSTAGIGVWRMAYARFITQPIFRRRVLVIGAGWAGQTIVDLLAHNSSISYDVVGFVDDDPGKQGQEFAGASVLGAIADLDDLVKQNQVHEVILAITGQITDGSHRHILNVYQDGVPVIPMLTLYETLAQRIPVEHCGDQWLTVLPETELSTNRLLELFQRILDLLGAGLLLLLASPLVPIVALLIRLDSAGPIFYRQERVGRWGVPFSLIKFRSMVEHAEQNGAVWAQVDDSRATRVGRWLRKTRIDEIPQLWNVLRGDMSLIGPRPERPEFIQELAQAIPFYKARLMAKPGLTGWAQVNYGYGSSVEDALVKLQYDLYYIKHRGLYLNLLIMLRTLGIVARMQGT